MNSAVESLSVFHDIRKAQQLSHYDYQELSYATDNWSPDKLIGKGTYGDVFKGALAGTEVAVKKLGME